MKLKAKQTLLMIFSLILVLAGLVLAGIYIVVLVGSTFGTATMLPVFIIGAGVLATICGALYICYSDEK